MQQAAAVVTDWTIIESDDEHQPLTQHHHRLIYNVFSYIVFGEHGIEM